MARPLRVTHTHTHTHTFNSPLSEPTQMSQYQKCKTNLKFTEARDSEWQCIRWAICEVGHMQVCVAHVHIHIWVLLYVTVSDAFYDMNRE